MLYYFLDHKVFIQKDSIPPGPRIIEYNSELMNLDGSFRSIDELTSTDEQYLHLKKINPKRADLIINKQYILDVKDFVITKNPESRPPNLDYLLLLHTLSGKRNRRKGSFTGLHYIERPFPNWVIVTEEKPPDKNGVWVAAIKIIQDGKILEKRGSDPSTLFPKDWHFQRVFDECLYAIMNKSLVEQTRGGIKYKSETRSGVPVFIYYGKEGKLKTIYPEYQGK